MDFPALRVRQWLKEWNRARQYWKEEGLGDPPQEFFVFSMQARMLARLSDVNRRVVDEEATREEETGIQRSLSAKRTRNIADFVRHGYPYSDMPLRKRADPEAESFKRPGWLPTSIVVNILKTSDERRKGAKVSPAEAVEIIPSGNGFAVRVPDELAEEDWAATGLKPFEVIDGQHRLAALASLRDGEDFEVPVVAFHGLELPWQAYLFWIINITPVRINSSLAFDLYPMLRSQAWLEPNNDLEVYREARAQELVDLIWSTEASPWYHRINLLGESGQETNMVTQSGWVRALTNSLLKGPRARGGRRGGLFTAPIVRDEPLQWSRAQEAAFLMEFGLLLRDHVARLKDPWAIAIRSHSKKTPQGKDAVWEGEHTLLNMDIGTQSLLQWLNDMCVELAEIRPFDEWDAQPVRIQSSKTDIATKELEALRHHHLHKTLKDLVGSLDGFNWASPSAPELDIAERTIKEQFRGGPGYKLLRIELLKQARAKGKDADVQAAAETLLSEHS